MSLRRPTQRCRWPVAQEHGTPESELDREWRPQERPMRLLGVTGGPARVAGAERAGGALQALLSGGGGPPGVLWRAGSLWLAGGG